MPDSGRIAAERLSRRPRRQHWPRLASASAGAAEEQAPKRSEKATAGGQLPVRVEQEQGSKRARHRYDHIQAGGSAHSLSGQRVTDEDQKLIGSKKAKPAGGLSVEKAARPRMAKAGRSKPEKAVRIKGGENCPLKGGKSGPFTINRGGQIKAGKSSLPIGGENCPTKAGKSRPIIRVKGRPITGGKPPIRPSAERAAAGQTIRQSSGQGLEGGVGTVNNSPGRNFHPQAVDKL